jgi:3-phosphoshikimate 1-carboxyvinyltransferase
MLPELIEIVPLDKPVRAEITVPGSKSITNRALILAALADGETTLQGALWSEDTQVMVDCLKKLGFAVKMDPDPAELCNRTITVKGLGGQIPNGGTADKPLELFVGNAGTAARFLSAMVCLGNGAYRLSGVPRMHERPQAALFKALRELGYRVDSPNDKLPAVIHGTEPFSRRSIQPIMPKFSEQLTVPDTGSGRYCTVSIEKSSQFASALLLCAGVGQWKVTVVGENAEESPYVAMTSKMIEAFPKNGGTYRVEPDASSGSYFLAANEINPVSKLEPESSEQTGEVVNIPLNDSIHLRNWPASDLQVDANFFAFVHLGGKFEFFKSISKGVLSGGFRLVKREPCVSRKDDLGDSIMTAIVIAPLLTKQWTFTHLGRLRLQETERVVALRTELTKCGAKVVEEGDTLTVYPSELHGAEIETYNDHRMAMCFAILGLKVPGIKIKNPACVKKTFPNFFQKLAASPPHGLGVIIRDAKTGRKLEGEELFAE